MVWCLSVFIVPQQKTEAIKTCLIHCKKHFFIVFYIAFVVLTADNKLRKKRKEKKFFLTFFVGVYGPAHAQKQPFVRS
jgi:hypothetical protein